MRIILDTNVIVSAFISRSGASREVLRRCLMSQDVPLVGAALLAEYESVLARNDLFRRSPVSSSERQQLWQALLSVSQWISVSYLWRPNLVDESDNHVLELAVAGNAQHLITHNVRDFSDSQLSFPDIPITTPAQYLKVV